MEHIEHTSEHACKHAGGNNVPTLYSLRSRSPNSKERIVLLKKNFNWLDIEACRHGIKLTRVKPLLIRARYEWASMAVIIPVQTHTTKPATTAAQPGR
jgi:hypothetical protein